MNSGLVSADNTPTESEQVTERPGHASSTDSPPTHSLSGMEEQMEKDNQKVYKQQFTHHHHQPSNVQNECNTPTGSVYHELQPYAPPTSHNMHPLASSAPSMAATPSSSYQFSSDSGYFGNNVSGPSSSHFNHPHKLQQQSPTFNASSSAGFFGNGGHPSSGYYHHQQQQQQQQSPHLQGDQQGMLPYFPALASSMNPWAPHTDQHHPHHQQQQKHPYHGYSQHHLHHNSHGQQRPHSQHDSPYPNMETPLTGEHESSSLPSFLNTSETPLPQQHRSSSNGSSGSNTNNVITTTAANNNNNNMLPPSLYPVSAYHPGMPLPKQSWPCGEAEDSNTSSTSSTIMPYHRSQHVFPGFPHHLMGQGHLHGASRSRSNTQWSATGKDKVTVALYNGDMWSKFHEHTNEMIITKHGRRMFPVLHFMMSNLDPSKLYHVYVDMVVADTSHWKFQGGNWISCGTAELLPEKGRKYVHPDSPNTGAHWMKQDVNFGKLKLTNNKGSKQKQVILNSMHRYQPQIHIAEDVDGVEGECIFSHAFVDTQFIAVTAYQNTDITQLKIDNNPFAKGFRENFDSRIAVATSLEGDGDLPLTPGGYGPTMHPSLTPQGHMAAISGPQPNPSGAYGGSYGYAHHQVLSGPQGMLGAMGGGPGGHQSLGVRPSVGGGVASAQSADHAQHLGASTFSPLQGNGPSSISSVDSHHHHHHQQHHPPQYMHNFLEQTSPPGLNDSTGSRNSACAMNQQQQEQQHAHQYHQSPFANNSPSSGSFESNHGYNNYFQFPQQQQQHRPLQPGQYDSQTIYHDFSGTQNRTETSTNHPPSCNFGQSINFLDHQERGQQDINFPACTSAQQTAGGNPSGFDSPHNLNSCMKGYEGFPTAEASATSMLEPLSCASSSPTLAQFSGGQAFNTVGGASMLSSQEDRFYSLNREKYYSDTSNLSEAVDSVPKETATNETADKLNSTSRVGCNELPCGKTIQNPSRPFPLSHQIHFGEGNGNATDRQDHRSAQNEARSGVFSNDQTSHSTADLFVDASSNSAFLHPQDSQIQTSDCQFGSYQSQKSEAYDLKNDENARKLSKHLSQSELAKTVTDARECEKEIQQKVKENSPFRQIPNFVYNNPDRSILDPNRPPSLNPLSKDSSVTENPVFNANDRNGSNQRDTKEASSSSMAHSQSSHADPWSSGNSAPIDEFAASTDYKQQQQHHHHQQQQQQQLQQQQRIKSGSKRRSSTIKTQGSKSTSGVKRRSSLSITPEETNREEAYAAAETSTTPTQFYHQQQLQQLQHPTTTSPSLATRKELPNWHSSRRHLTLQRSSSAADRLSPSEGRVLEVNSAPNTFNPDVNSLQSTSAPRLPPLTASSSNAGSCKYDESSHYHHIQRTSAHAQNNFADFRSGPVTRIVNPFDV